MSYRILSSNVIIVESAEYSLVTPPDGTLVVERPDGNVAILDIRGNVRADTFTIASLANANNDVVAVDANGQMVLTGYDANNLGNMSYLTTGVLPSGRLAGDYSFDNLTASGNITANTLIGNLSVSQLTSGTLPAGRLAGDYAFGNLSLSGNLTSAWVHANLDANQLSAGTVPDARLSGPYTFDSLTLTSNLTSAWVHANIDAARLTTGVLHDDRLQGAYTFDSLTVGILAACRR